MNTEMTLHIIEVLFAVRGAIFGTLEYYKRQKLEKVLKTITQSYPGDVAKIEQSCVWGWRNVREALDIASTIPDCPQKTYLIKSIGSAVGDTASSARMCTALFNQLLSFQEAQFNSRNISHLEKNSLDLCNAERENITGKRFL